MRSEDSARRMDSSIEPNNGDGLDRVEDVFDNPLRQTPAVAPDAPAQPQPSSPTVGAPPGAVFEAEESEASTRPAQHGKAAQRTKMLRVKPEENDDKAKTVRNKTEEKHQQKDEKLQRQQMKKGSGRVARLGEGMRRQMLRFQSSVIYHHDDTSRDDPRKLGAELMWKRIFAMLDVKNDHSLTTVELREGLEVVRNRWAELQELYPCGEAAFAEHLILGAQDDPEQDPTRLMATIGAEGECEQFPFGFCRILPSC